jgi:hypothetical protein
MEEEEEDCSVHQCVVGMGGAERVLERDRIGKEGQERKASRIVP